MIEYSGVSGMKPPKTAIRAAWITPKGGPRLRYHRLIIESRSSLRSQAPSIERPPMYRYTPTLRPVRGISCFHLIKGSSTDALLLQESRRLTDLIICPRDVTDLHIHPLRDLDLRTSDPTFSHR